MHSQRLDHFARLLSISGAAEPFTLGTGSFPIAPFTARPFAIAATDTVREGTDTTTTLAVNGSVNGTIDAEPISGDGVTSDGQGGFIDKDWYKVTLTKNHNYTFEGDEISLTSDEIVIRLYDQNGVAVGSAQFDEGSAPSFHYSTTSQVNTTQTYYLAVSAGGDDPEWKTATGNFEVSLDDDGAVTTDAVREGTDTTTTLAVNGSVNGTIDAEPMSGDGVTSDGQGGFIDKDWYKVTLTKNHRYTFEGDEVSLTSDAIVIRLYDQNGVALGSSHEGSDPSFVFDTDDQANTTQTYYLAVSAGGDDPEWKTATGDFEVSLTDEGPTGTTDTVREGTDTTSTLAVDGTVNGTIDAEPISGDGEASDGQGGFIDKDWYRVTLTKGHSYTFDASSISLTTDQIAIRLYDASGFAVGSAQYDDGSDTSFDFDTTSQSGATQTYYLAVSASGSEPAWRTATGNFSASLTDNGPMGTTDTVREGTDTAATLAVDGTVNGTIDAEPISGDGVTSDGQGGFIDKDWYKVTLTKGHNYTFSGSELTVTSGAIVIRLYDQNGVAVGAAQFAEGSDPSFDFNTASQVNATQTYFLAVSAGGADPAWKTATGNFEISLTETIIDPDDDDYADEPSDATAPIGEVTVDGSVLGFIGAADANDSYGDKDVFKVHLEAGQTYQVRMENESIDGQALPYCIFTVRDDDDFTSILSTSAIGSDVSTTFSVGEDGDYFIRTGTGGEPTDMGGYKLSVTDITPPDGTPDDYKDDPSDSGNYGALNSNSYKKGVLEVSGDKDVFTTQVVEGQRYQFVLTGEGNGADAALTSGYMTIRGPGFEDVLEEGGSGHVTSFYYDAEFTGTAFVRVGSGSDGGGTGAYRLSVSTQTTPPPPPPPDPDDSPIEVAGQFLLDVASSPAIDLIHTLTSDEFWYGLNLVFGALDKTDAVSFAHSVVGELDVFEPLGIALEWSEAINHVILADDDDAAEQLVVELVDAFAAWSFSYLGKIGGTLGGLAFGGPIGGVIGSIAGSIGSSWIYEEFLSDDVRDEVDFLWDGVEDLQDFRVGLIPENGGSEDGVVPFDEEFYVSTYADVGDAIASGAVGSAYAHYITVGIDLGYQPNAGQTLTRDDLAFSVLNNDPAALGNAALFTAALGNLAADGTNGPERALFNAATASTGAAHGTVLDETLSAIAYRKTLDLVANGPGNAVNRAAEQSDSTWADQWSDGSAFAQHFAGDLDEVLGAGAPDGRYELFIVTSASSRASDVLAQLTSQDGWNAASAYDTIGIAEYGGVWVALLADRIGSYSVQEPGTDTLKSISTYGSLDDDTLYAGTRTARLFGLAGDDMLVGGKGDDILDGGEDEDLVSYLTATSGVTVSLAVATAQDVGGGQGLDTLINIEKLEGSNFNDHLTGDAGDNTLRGRGGNDVLKGGTGIDMASYNFANGGVTVSLAVTGKQVIGADEGSDTLKGIEDLKGSTFDDVLTGAVGANKLIGLDGNDLLEGGGGEDDLNGGNGSDTASYVNAVSGVTVDLQTTDAQTVGGGQGIDTLSAIENLTGSTFDDHLTGKGKTNELTGLDGADTLLGLTGNDTLWGGRENDHLEGGDGADLLFGGQGQDKLYGGRGGDVFAYAGTGGSTGTLFDTIMDFSTAVDKFDLWPGATITAVDYVTGGGLRNLDLPTGHAVVYRQSETAASVSLVVDVNGIAGYQADEDFRVLMKNTDLSELTVDHFI